MGVLKQNSSRARNKQGALITWEDVSFTVMDRATGTQKTIVSNMWGMAQPGRLLAIMGPSGAGKSTLLDVLACNMEASGRGSTLEGRITVDGQPRSVRQFRRISSYVQQKDVLLSSATVREVILTSALLRLPRSLPSEAKRALVDSTLKELDLTGCADTLIGDETIGLKGISGGQKRRVSVGVELVKDPRVLFLDEPSSGLDSEMALGVMTALVRLARKGRTVLCTIHQPNSDITDTFDDFLLLAGGRTVYGGLWSGAVDFFAQAGFSCPSFKNPTDYFLSVVTHDTASAVQTLAAEYDRRRPELLAAMVAEGRRSMAGGASGYSTYGNSGTDADAQHVVLEVQEPAAAPEGPDGSSGVVAAVTQRQSTGLGLGLGLGLVESEEGEQGEDEWDHGAPLWFQVMVLSARVFRTWLRSPIMLASELVQYVFIAVFIGLMYCKFNDIVGQGDYNRASCIWFSFAVLCFTPAYTAVTNWAAERQLLKRELTQRMYGINAYYLSRYAVLLPFEAAQCLVFVAIMYFFAGFYPSAVNFFSFFAAFVMFQIISEGIGACCAVVTRTATTSIILLTFVLLLVLAFSGFLLTKTPIYFVWVQKASYMSYASAALLELELSSVTLTDPNTGASVPGMQVYPPALSTGLTYAQNMGVLAAQMGGMELLKLFAFHAVHRLNMM